MIVSELVVKLSSLNQDAEVVVFVEGKLYSCHQVETITDCDDRFDGMVEIGCGWTALDVND